MDLERMPATRLLVCIVALILGGCTTIPENISTPVPGPGIHEVRTDPGAHTGARVRWGGTISEVSNLQDHTIITIVARPLTRQGEPLSDAAALGRFLGEVDRFLDPEEYKPGRRVTVVGRFTEIRPGKIDQYVYDYPVVGVQDLYKWPEYVRRDPYYPWPHYYRPYPYWYAPYPHRHPGFMQYPWYYY
jgi:outer membrane lipoprotein